MFRKLSNLMFAPPAQAQTYATEEDLAKKIHEMILENQSVVKIDAVVQWDNRIREALKGKLRQVLTATLHAPLVEIVNSYARENILNLILTNLFANKKKVPMSYNKVESNALNLVFLKSKEDEQNTPLMRSTCQYLLQQGAEVNGDLEQAVEQWGECDLDKQPGGSEHLQHLKMMQQSVVPYLKLKDTASKR